MLRFSGLWGLTIGILTASVLPRLLLEVLRRGAGTRLDSNALGSGEGPRPPGLGSKPCRFQPGSQRRQIVAERPGETLVRGSHGHVNLPAPLGDAHVHTLVTAPDRQVQVARGNRRLDRKLRRDPGFGRRRRFAGASGSCMQWSGHPVRISNRARGWDGVRIGCQIPGRRCRTGELAFSRRSGASIQFRGVLLAMGVGYIGTYSFRCGRGGRDRRRLAHTWVRGSRIDSVR